MTDSHIKKGASAPFFCLPISHSWATLFFHHQRRISTLIGQWSLSISDSLIDLPDIRRREPLRCCNDTVSNPFTTNNVVSGRDILDDRIARQQSTMSTLQGTDCRVTVERSSYLILPSGDWNLPKPHRVVVDWFDPPSISPIPEPGEKMSHRQMNPDCR